MDRYLIVISTLWHSAQVCLVKRFSIRFNSQISNFWEHVPLILQLQGTSLPSALKNPGTAPAIITVETKTNIFYCYESTPRTSTEIL